MPARRLICAALLAVAACPAAELKLKTLRAFESYIQGTEARVQQQTRAAADFLWAAQSPQRRSRALRGEVLTEAWRGKGEIEVPDGLIHDWIGAVFIPGATLERTLALVQNYDGHKNVYQPEVIDSKLLGRNGNDFRIRLRLLKKKVITVVLNTEHDVRYFPVDATRCHSRSYSSRIAEVEDPGEPGEREKPPGKDHGFLWRLYSYWRFQESDGGVWVECQAISLTRDVPTGLGWLIQPIIRDLPKESLIRTLSATRAALVGQASRPVVFGLL